MLCIASEGSTLHSVSQLFQESLKTGLLQMRTNEGEGGLGLGAEMELSGSIAFQCCYG